jgi:hypothetical protein
VRSSEERRSRKPVAGSADTSAHIGLARLELPRRQAEVGAHVARAPEPGRIIDRRLERQSGDWADPRNGHEASAELVARCQSQELAVQAGELDSHRRASLKKSFQAKFEARVAGYQVAHPSIEGAPRRCPRRISPLRVAEIERLRRERMRGPAIARALGMARSTVGLVLRRLGLGKLKHLEPKSPVVRYERSSRHSYLRLRHSRSMKTLSIHRPRPSMETRTPAPFSTSMKRGDVNWLLWSVLKISGAP